MTNEKQLDKEKKHLASDQQSVRIWPILIIIFIITIIILLILFVKGKNNRSNPNISANPSEILSLLPQPSDNLVKSTEEPINTEEPKTEKQSAPSPSPAAATEESISEEVKTIEITTINEEYQTTIPALELMNVAPINSSYVAGNTIQLAFSVSNNSYVVIKRAEFKQSNGLTKVQESLINLPDKSTYRTTYVIPVSIPEKTIQINLKLILSDIYDQVKELNFTYYKR